MYDILKTWLTIIYKVSNQKFDLYVLTHSLNRSRGKSRQIP